MCIRMTGIRAQRAKVAVFGRSCVAELLVHATQQMPERGILGAHFRGSGGVGASQIDLTAL